MPNPYFFLLGRTPLLSKLELEVLSNQAVSEILPEKVMALEFNNDLAAEAFFQQLGGSLKLLRPEGEFALFDEDGLKERIVAYLAQFERPTFALAEFGREQIEKIDLTAIKKTLKDRQVASRFIEGTRQGLSASVLLHQKNIIELNVIQTPEKIFFAKTLACQNIDDWTVRDREKPYADRKKGMLPPKVARMMVNLALGHLKSSNPQISVPTIYDPFCGSGTVLLEAAMQNCAVIGSDLDQRAAIGTRDNLAWFKAQYQTPDLISDSFVADVTGVKPQQLKQAVDAIVTEPFLGKPTPDSAQLPNIFKGLEKLYLGAFKNWTKLLKDQGIVVMIFPVVQAGRRSFSLEGIIDKLQQLGYTPLSEPVLYHRPQAVVQRQIWSFRFTK